MGRDNEITIALNGTKDCVVSLTPDQLPENPEDMLDLLTGEAVSFSVWWDVVRAYLEAGKVDQCLHILFTAVAEDTIEEAKRFYGHDNIHEQLCFNIGLSAILCARARDEKDAKKAANFVATAKKIDPNETLPYIGAGLLALAQVRLTHMQLHVQTAQTMLAGVCCTVHPHRLVIAPLHVLVLMHAHGAAWRGPRRHCIVTGSHLLHLTLACAHHSSAQLQSGISPSP